MRLMFALLALAFAGTVAAATSASFTSNGTGGFTSSNPAIHVDAATTGVYGSTSITINGVRYAGRASYTPVTTVGLYTYYQSDSTVLPNADGTASVTATVFMHRWSTGSGRYITQHYVVDSGTATLN